MKKSELKALIREVVEEVALSESVASFAEELAKKFSKYGARASTQRGVEGFNAYGLRKNPKAVVKFDDYESMKAAWEELKTMGTSANVSMAPHTGSSEQEYVKVGDFYVSKNSIVSSVHNERYENNYFGIFTAGRMKNRSFRNI